MTATTTTDERLVLARLRAHLDAARAAMGDACSAAEDYESVPDLALVLERIMASLVLVHAAVTERLIHTEQG
jgi:hypothetical protein